MWSFAERWGAVPDSDLQAAIATCLIEHLLEDHFELVSPLVIAAIAIRPVLAETVAMCWLPDELVATESARLLGLRPRYGSVKP